MSQISNRNNERLPGQKGSVIWLTGLSGSGKSTIASELASKLTASERFCYVLDGDVIRQGLNRDLGFSPGDRAENIRRVGHLAALLADAGLIVITAFISPYRSGRRAARACVPDGRFIEVYLNTPLDICESRDPKGLYVQARNGDIPQFTGISAPYEQPEYPELTIDTGSHDASDCADDIIGYLMSSGIMLPPDFLGDGV